MLPTVLEMEGFGSFRNLTKIDFTDLSLAAFAGPTGSGKSTIIDAITFALYGRIPRYPSNALAPVINKGASQATVSLRFVAGGTEYVAARTVVLKKDNKASTAEARLERSDGEVLAGQANEMSVQVQALLGLTYDQFTKTVILPQGQFAQFLNDSASDRQDTLKHILDLGVYDTIKKAAAKRAADAEVRMEAHRERASTADSEDVVLEKRGNARRLQKEHDRLIGRISEWSELEETKAELRERSSRLDEVSEQAKQINTPPGVAHLTDTEKSAQQEVKDLELTVQETREVRVAADQAKKQGPQRPECESLVRRLLELDRLRKEAIEAGDLIRCLGQKARETDRSWTQADGELQAAEESVEGVSQEKERLEGLYELHEKRIEASENLHVAQVAASEALIDAREAVLRFEDARSDRQQGEYHDQAATIARDLGLGATCPVCLQTVDSKSLELSSVHFAAQECTPVETLREEEAFAERARLEASAKETRTSEALEREKERISEIEDALATALGSPTLQGVDSQLKRKQLSKDIKGLAEALTQAESDSQAADDHKASLAQELMKTKEERAAATGKSDTLIREIHQLEDKVPHDVSLSVAQSHLKEATRLVAELEKAQEAEQDSQQQLEEARSELEEATSAAREADGFYSQARDKAAAVVLPQVSSLGEQADDGLLPISQGSLLERWMALEQWCLDQAEWLQTQIKELNAEQSQIEKKQTLWRDAAEQAYEEHFDTSFPVDEWQKQMLNVVSAAQADAQQSDRSYQEALRDNQQAEEAEQRWLIADDLVKELQPRRFPTWKMNHMLSLLADSASERLHNLSGGQFDFRVNGGGFQVWDHINEAERATRSLSGGETFLASLSLALALAEQQSSLGKGDAPTLGSLFVDEGFGSLDTDTLDVVASALESLGEDRMVCVVTHIRELAERMPVRYEVSRLHDSSFVSRIDADW